MEETLTDSDHFSHFLHPEASAEGVQPSPELDHGPVAEGAHAHTQCAGSEPHADLGNEPKT